MSKVWSPVVHMSEGGLSSVVPPGALPLPPWRRDCPWREPISVTLQIPKARRATRARPAAIANFGVRTKTPSFCVKVLPLGLRGDGSGTSSPVMRIGARWPGLWRATRISRRTRVDTGALVSMTRVRRRVDPAGGVGADPASEPNVASRLSDPWLKALMKERSGRDGVASDECGLSTMPSPAASLASPSLLLVSSVGAESSRPPLRAGERIGEPESEAAMRPPVGGGETERCSEACEPPWKSGVRESPPWLPRGDLIGVFPSAPRDGVAAGTEVKRGVEKALRTGEHEAARGVRSTETPLWVPLRLGEMALGPTSSSATVSSVVSRE
mmetsp:Transcript_66279/g.194392  ORF Transcript_66279/g.194392 Transcript_66279/m.194392 type:complete len:327 (+) Transcript_66279:389-1369(+)